MTAPITVVTNFPKAALNALIALGTLKAMFVDAAFTPVQDTLDFINDASPNESTGTSYPAGGIVVTTPTVTVDTAANTVTLDADDITTAGLSVSCRWVIVFFYTGSLSTSPVVNVFDASEGAGGNVTVTGFRWDATNGILQFLVP